MQAPPMDAGSRRRVLVVEDEPLNLRLAITLVERLGHEALSAGCGRDAVALLQREHVDLLLLDLGLPDMRGHRVARHLRKLEATAHLPIYALTAEDEALETLTEAGFDGYIPKPLREEELRRVLASAGGPALLDLDDLRDRVCGDEELVRELLADFVALADDLVDGLAQAVHSGDRSATKAAAHRLKGALLAIGANRAAASTRTLEDCSDRVDASTLGTLLDAVANDVAEARSAANAA